MKQQPLDTINRVKELREVRGLSQRQLAARAGTSQQQIQRIESNVQLARYDLAARIAEALETPLAAVFPGAAPALQQMTRLSKKLLSKKHVKALPADALPALGAALAEGGIDMSSVSHIWRFRLRNGYEGSYRLSGPARNGLYDHLYENKEHRGFLLIDTETHRVAVRHDQLASWQFVRDPRDESEPTSNLDFSVVAVFCDSATPTTVRVARDRVKIEENEQERYDDSQMQYALWLLECDDMVVTFDDADGSPFFVRREALALLAAPQLVVSPDMEIDSD